MVSVHVDYLNSLRHCPEGLESYFVCDHTDMCMKADSGEVLGASSFCVGLT